MPSALLQAAGRPLLGAGERDRMRTRAAECVRRARRSDECPVAITAALAPGADPTAIAVASRRPGEDWFCFENPDRDRFALATLGRAAALDDRDEGRFERVAARWRALVADPACDEGGPVASAASPSRPTAGRRRTGPASSPPRCRSPSHYATAAPPQPQHDARRRALRASRLCTARRLLPRGGCWAGRR
jgi:hypothetical protein